jgi:hypothetical protein
LPRAPLFTRAKPYTLSMRAVYRDRLRISRRRHGRSTKRDGVVAMMLAGPPHYRGSHSAPPGRAVPDHGPARSDPIIVTAWLLATSPHEASSVPSQATLRSENAD